MPETHKDLYAAACNPPRRVKRSTIPVANSLESSSSAPPAATTSSSSPQHQHRPILPMRPYAPREAPSVSATTTSREPVVPPPPAKRGRKPGPLSRTAREAQRRLNHSIIEKARRTKINDALATLKQLVPPNYGPGQMKQQQQPTSAGNCDEEEEEEDDEDDDDEYDDGTKKKKVQQQKTKANPKGAGTGKKEEKEKEFKLEILVRTVSFLQDLLERVSVLESAPLPSLAPPPVSVAEAPTSSPPICPNCGAEFGRTTKGREPSNSNPKKRKRIHMDTLDDSEDQHHEREPEKADSSGRHAKIPRRYGRCEDRTLYDQAADLDVNMDRDRDAAPVPVSVPVPRSKAFPDRPHRGSQTDAPHPRSHSSSSPTDRLPPISSWLHNNSHLLNQERPKTRSPPSPSSTSTPPSINNCVIDPQLLPPSSSSSIISASEPVKASRSRTHSYSNASIHPQQSYLPSPPGSTHFDPMRSSSAGAPPLLSLGPVATDATKTKPTTKANHGGSPSSSPDIRAHAGNRTPEDESAATLLLQIASSPTFRAVGSETSSPVFRGISSSSSLSESAGSSAMKRGGRGDIRDREFDHADERDPSVFMLSSSSSDVRSEVVPSGTGRRYGSVERRRHHDHEHGHGDHHQQAQTPSSLLGLKLEMGARRGY